MKGTPYFKCAEVQLITTLMAESEEELKSLLMKVKEESEKVSLKLSIQKLFCGIYLALKCSFDEFVREKVVSLCYSSILGLPPTFASFNV